MFDHYIFTRSDYPKEYKDLDYRIKIFKEHTLPSILNQTNQNFKWIIKTTNQEFIKECKDYNNIIIVNNLEEYFISSKEWMIMTRLDNDNALENNYINEIQKCFNKKEMLIDSKGRRYNYIKNIYIDFNIYTPTKTSPFISIIKKTINPNHIFIEKHANMYKYYEVKILDKSLWIQIIHEKNKLMRWK